MPKYKFTVTQYANVPETGEVESYDSDEALEKVQRLYPDAEPHQIEISEKGEVLKKVGEGAATAGMVVGAGAVGIVGCLLQCVMAAIPVLIGLWIIGFLLRSCS
ncbi:hypothetical protein OAI07_00775 [Akkermansiaceae bacterium]|nr:hypothetical protein [Akkermansiaceae bacterium]